MVLSTTRPALEVTPPRFGSTLELTRSLPGETVGVGEPAVGQPASITLDLRSFSFTTPFRAAGETSGAGAGPTSGNVLDVITSGPSVPSTLQGGDHFSKAELIQRDTSGRVVADFVFDAVDFAAGSLVVRGNAIVNDDQFLFGAVQDTATQAPAPRGRFLLQTPAAPTVGGETQDSTVQPGTQSVVVSDFSFDLGGTSIDSETGGAGSGKAVPAGRLDVTSTGPALRAVSGLLSAHEVLLSERGQHGETTTLTFDSVILESATVTGAAGVVSVRFQLTFGAVQETAPQGPAANVTSTGALPLGETSDAGVTSPGPLRVTSFSLAGTTTTVGSGAGVGAGKADSQRLEVTLNGLITPELLADVQRGAGFPILSLDLRPGKAGGLLVFGQGNGTPGDELLTLGDVHLVAAQVTGSGDRITTRLTFSFTSSTVETVSDRSSHRLGRLLNPGPQVLPVDDVFSLASQLSEGTRLGLPRRSSLFGMVGQ
jgi:hypothetical protein